MANSYSAGNLEFKIQTVGDNSTAIFSNLNNELNRMAVLLGTVNTKLLELGTTSKSISRVSFKWTEKSATGLDKITNLDTSNFTKKMQELTTSITPFVDKLKSAETSLLSLSNILQLKIGNKNKSKTSDLLPKSITDLQTSKNFSLNQFFNKVLYFRNITKQLTRNITQIVQNGIDYTETLNLWQVAMRGNVDEAENFIKKMNKAYGIATQTLMKYQATFKNMLSSLGGINENVSFQLSEYLTQMALDYASLYNVSIEKAMTTFQSVLSGSIRPIRSISGYDISESTIYQLYQQLGGEKTMRQLSQTEKRLLRIYAIFEQMESSGTIKDLNKTINNSANQSRILTENIKELTTWLGLLLEQHIRPILIYLNAGIKTLTNIIKAVAKASNLELFDGTVTQNFEDINKEIDEMSGKLLDFDKFSVLGGSGGLGATKNIGIDTKLLNGLKQYQSILENVNNDATKLAEEWTNFFIDNTGELKKFTKGLLFLLKAISIYLLIIIGYKITTKIAKLFTMLISIKNLSISSSIIKLFNTLDLQIIKATASMSKLTLVANGVTMALTAVAGAILFDSIISLLPEKQRMFASFLSTIIGGLVTILGLIVAIRGGVEGGLIGATIAGLGIGALVAGIKGIANYKAYKNGGVVEDGIFTMSKGELIGNFDDGTTVVANNEQIIAGIENGVYRAVKNAMQGQGKDIVVNLDGKQIARANVNNTAMALSNNYNIKLNPR